MTGRCKDVTPEQRFWEKVEKTPGCWNWTGCKAFYGAYGWFRLNGKKVLAHRASWILANGPIPGGLVVRHHCDNGLCIRLSHLALGTKADNSRDAAERHRMKSGAEHHSAKLSRVEVREIRERRAAGAILRVLAEQFQVSEHTVWRIVNERTWRGV